MADVRLLQGVRETQSVGRFAGVLDALCSMFCSSSCLEGLRVKGKGGVCVFGDCLIP